MASYKLLMPKMGESVIEATILSWNKKIGDKVQENDVILEVATDKVDTEVPANVTGILSQILFEEGSVVPVGEVLAIIETEQYIVEETSSEIKKQTIEKPETIQSNENNIKIEIQEKSNDNPKTTNTTIQKLPSNTFSPLILNIAKIENISIDELNTIKGTGLNDRLTKNDVLKYLEDKKDKNTISNTTIKEEIQIANKTVQPNYTPKTTTQLEDTIIEMDRVRKIISKNMLDSKRISAHVSSFVECDITNIVKWRNKNKDNFKLKYGFNLTYLPVFIEAIAQCIKEFPNINVSIKDDNIIYKKNINIGIATALPNGNLIVPVIKDADKKNILGIASEINSLVEKARNNKLTSDDISDGTYTVSNIGSFGNILGTPIIVQPQVAIMAIGVATKKPVVIEIDDEDVIAIRHMLYLSHTYDHRIIDGMLGGTFVKRVADYLQLFNVNKEI
jgi:2-oxoglutarate dehydrogenase E2 component (dihydrolipoamide succinyltransferase)